MNTTKARKSMIKVRGAFSESIGIQNCVMKVQYDDFDERTRMQISNELYRLLEFFFEKTGGFNSSIHFRESYGRNNGAAAFSFFVATEVFNERIIEIGYSADWRRIFDAIHSVIVGAVYNEVLDMVWVSCNWLADNYEIYNDNYKNVNTLTDDNQDEFRSSLKNFLRFYAYITQITRMFDAELHKSYLFCEYLFRLLPKRPHERIDLDDQILLVNSKLTETFSGSIALRQNAGATIKPERRTSVKRKVEKKDLLENIIEKINLLYQGNFTDADRVIVETIFDRMFHESKKLRRHAQNSDEEMFSRSIFPEEFEKIAEDCYTESMDSFAKLFENKEFYDRVMAEMAKAIYYSLRNTSRYRL